MNGTKMNSISNYPEWISGFHKKCLEINGTRCFEKLDELMGLYIKHIKDELILCALSPNRSKFIATNIYRTMLFFHGYYVNIKEFFVMSQWNEHMVELLSMYCQLEMRAAMREQRGKETDEIICARIMTVLTIYLHKSEEHMIHVLLKVKDFKNRHKDMFDPIFMKLLITKQTTKSLTDMEYIRNLLAFKLWKRLYCKEEKKTISDLAISRLKPPRSFIVHSKRYKFLPRYSDKSNVNVFLVTAKLELDDVIKEYFVYLDSNKINCFESGFYTANESSLFIKNASEVQPNENFILDKIKEEIDAINTFDQDDDVIIIDQDSEPVGEIVKHFPAPILTDFIDLTEQDSDFCSETEPTPEWCQEIIKLAEEKPLTVLESESKSVSVPKEPEANEVSEASTQELNVSEDNTIDVTEITSTSQNTVVASVVPEKEFGTVDSTSNLNGEESELMIDVESVEPSEDDLGTQLAEDELDGTEASSDTAVSVNLDRSDVNSAGSVQDKTSDYASSPVEPNELPSPPEEPLLGLDSHMKTFKPDNDFLMAFSSSSDLMVNKNKKVRTYNSKVKKKCEVPVGVIVNNGVTETQVRRVPPNGDKAVHFQIAQAELSAKMYTFPNYIQQKFDLQHLESSLFFPTVFLSKANPANYVSKFDCTDMRDCRAYMQWKSGRKTIVEQCSYVKSAPELSRCKQFTSPSTSHDLKPSAVPVRAKRGTVCPDLDVNFQSLTLNSSFQNHFCSDITTCESTKCLEASHVSSSSFLASHDRYKPETVALPPVNDPTSDPPYWRFMDAAHAALQQYQSGSDLPATLDPDTHLPIKKRKVSSLTIDINGVKDEISYPAIPMISIAALESIKTETISRPFKTPAELKEVPPLPPSYLCSTVPSSLVTDNINLSHTYNTPTINYHVNNVPVINFQYTPHYELPALQPLVMSMSRTNSTSWNEASYNYTKMPTAGKSESNSTGCKKIGSSQSRSSGSKTKSRQRTKRKALN